MNLTEERARLRREAIEERIADANAADFLGVAYGPGYPTRERVARWNEEYLALVMKEKEANG